MAGLDRRRLWKPFTQMQDYQQEEPLIVVEGKGNWLRDQHGNALLDGVSSLWVNVHGHQVKEIDDAISAQLHTLAHSTLLGPTHTPAIELADELVRRSPSPRLSRVFYSDSGSTAVEIAIKMAFQYWQQQAKESGGEARTRFITFKNAYHGDTLGAVAVGGMDLFHSLYQPLLFETHRAESAHCYRCPLDLQYPSCRIQCLESLERAFSIHRGKVAALVLEPRIQAAAGILVHPKEFVREAVALARDHGALVIADEVAVGLGRTGRLWACQEAGIEPDLLCVAKGLSGGYLPLAATLATEEIYEAFLGKYQEFRTFFHGHSYTGNPLACAASLASLKRFDDEGVLARVGEVSARMAERKDAFLAHPRVGDVRHLGVFLGIEVVRDKETKDPYPPALRLGQRVVAWARQRGVLVRPLGNVMVVNPPLSITDDELDLLLGVTWEAITAVTAELDREPLPETSKPPSRPPGKPSPTRTPPPPPPPRPTFRVLSEEER